LAQMALTDTKLAAGPSADASADRNVPPAGATNFEQSFDLAERQLANALKAVKTLKATVTSARGAAVTGDVAQLAKSLQAAKVAAEQVRATLSSAEDVLHVGFREGGDRGSRGTSRSLRRRIRERIRNGISSTHRGIRVVRVEASVHWPRLLATAGILLRKSSRAGLQGAYLLRRSPRIMVNEG
ncbi:MAG: hypothetical protein ACREM6_07985, partial [Vulcanimicrobiaceae bacterium]